MALGGLISQETAETGLTAKYDRQNRFRLTRHKDSSGFHVYSLENASTKQKIWIRRHLFDRVRAGVVTARKRYGREEIKETAPIAIRYKRDEIFRIQFDRSGSQKVIIQELDPLPGSSGFMTIDRMALKTLSGLLFHDKILHPDEVLTRIVGYHKLVQFSFTEASESINSDLALRKGVLSHSEIFVPAVGERGASGLVLGEAVAETIDVQALDTSKIGKVSGDPDLGSFKSRLGERRAEKAYEVDFEALFGGRIGSSSKPASKRRKRGDGSEEHSRVIPLLAADVKSYLNPSV